MGCFAYIQDVTAIVDFCIFMISCAKCAYLHLTKRKLRFKEGKKLVPRHRASKYKARIHTQVCLLPMAMRALMH